MFNCKRKDIIIKYPIDALQQIKNKVEEGKHVLSLAFETIDSINPKVPA